MIINEKASLPRVMRDERLRIMRNSQITKQILPIVYEAPSVILSMIIFSKVRNYDIKFLPPASVVLDFV